MLSDSQAAGAQKIAEEIARNVGRVILGKEEQIQLILASWVSGGHVLLEDVPGTGKTILARALAKSCHTTFSRVQFTPDLLPADILGTSIYNQREQAFEFLPGPVFTQILLADEINRATPRTQSALLEAMSEGQVTTEGKSRLLDDLFFVLATQNPVDQLGTFTLPEAQLDRFMIRLSLGYPEPQQEIAVIQSQYQQHPIHSIEPIVESDKVLGLRELISQVTLSPEVLQYIVDIVNKTRHSQYVKLGASPRASLALSRLAQAHALLAQGKGFVTPQLVFDLAPFVLSHRIILNTEARLSEITSGQVIKQILQECKVPIRHAS